MHSTLAATALDIDDATADLLFREARTVNAFDGSPVTDEQIRAAWDLLRWGPTAMNSLPLRMFLVRTDDSRERLVKHMAEGNREKTLNAPLTIVVALDPNFHEHLPTLAPHMSAMKDQFEAGGVAMRADFARTSALIQTGYLIVALRAVGLHVGPMTGFDAQGVDEEFFMSNGWRSLVVMNVGRPAATDASYPRQTRLEFDDVTLVG